MSPKITIVQLLHSMTVGGAEVLAAGLARRLGDRYRFVFVCLDSVGELGEQLRDEGFPLVVLHRGTGIDWTCSRALKEELKSQEATIVHAHQYTPFFYALTTGILGRRPPILFTEHGRFFPDLPNRKHAIFNRLLMRKNDRIVGVGEAVRKALVDNEGIPENRTQVIYNGIDVTKFESTDASARSTIRNELAIGENDFVVSLVGRLNDLKDHSTAIRTARRVAEQLPNFRMLFVGEGEERTKIESEIRDAQLEKTITLLGTRHDIPEILQASDVCFLSSLSEGIPLTLIEGMAAGLPVVATDVGGNSEVVIQNETGYLAPSGDDEALAGYLITLGNDPALRRQLGAAGRQRAHQHFSEIENHRRYQELYDVMSGIAST